METVNGVAEGPPPPSPLTGCYLLVVLGEPHTGSHKDIILERLAKGLLSWNVNNCLVDLEKELTIVTEQGLEGEEARYGERLIQFASENLVTEILIHPSVSTLVQCVRNLLSSFTRHRHIIHAGYTFAANGSWILQDGTFSLVDFSEAFQEVDVQRVIRAYENGISFDIHCSPEGDWVRLPKESFARGCKLRINPDDVLESASPAIANFVNYISPFLVPAELESSLESSDVVGNIRFSRPTLYVFPGGQGDAALFGINGFNMLVDGGFSRKACFWDFVRHLDRLDAVMLTRLNNSNTNGIGAVLRRKAQNAVYPQIGHFFCNIQNRKANLSPDGDKDKDPLVVNLLEEGQDLISNLRSLELNPQLCYRDTEPINLYHKVGHGTLDMYVINPAKDSREVKEFLLRWNSNDQKLFANHKFSRECMLPLQNIVSICALLIWRPANPNDTITRILFPGSAPQNKIFEGLDKLKNLECIKHTVCTERTLAPPPKPKSKENILDKIAALEKPRPEIKKSKPKQQPENKLIEDNLKNGLQNGHAEKVVKKSGSIESDKSDTKPPRPRKEENKITESNKQEKDKTLKSKPETNGVRVRQKPSEKKPSPPTPKRTTESKKSELDKETTNQRVRSKISPSATPAKSTKDATNRRVLESKTRTAPRKEIKETKPTEKKEEPKKVERKPISRRPKAEMKMPQSPVKRAINGSQKPDSLSRKSKLDRDVTTDSSTVSTPSVDQDNLLKKDISKLTPEELQQLKAQELAELKEEQEAIKELEAVFRKGDKLKEEPSDLRKVKDISIDDKTDTEEYLIVEKDVVEPSQPEESEADAKEEETVKLARDSEESEKKKDESETNELDKDRQVDTEQEESGIGEQETDLEEGEDLQENEISKEPSIQSPDENKKILSKDEEVKEQALESQPDEKVSANVESGATTTAPTLPEDERIPLNEIKEDTVDQIEEKHVKEETKEKETKEEIPVITFTTKTAENVTKLPSVVGIRLDKETRIRDIVKTPDEVADLPVHEEVDVEHLTEFSQERPKSKDELYSDSPVKDDDMASSKKSEESPKEEEKLIGIVQEEKEKKATVSDHSKEKEDEIVEKSPLQEEIDVQIETKTKQQDKDELKDEKIHEDIKEFNNESVEKHVKPDEKIELESKVKEKKVEKNVEISSLTKGDEHKVSREKIEMISSDLKNEPKSEKTTDESDLKLTSKSNETVVEEKKEEPIKELETEILDSSIEKRKESITEKENIGKSGSTSPNKLELEEEKAEKEPIIDSRKSSIISKDDQDVEEKKDGPTTELKEDEKQAKEDTEAIKREDENEKILDSSKDKHEEENKQELKEKAKDQDENEIVTSSVKEQKTSIKDEIVELTKPEDVSALPANEKEETADRRTSVSKKDDRIEIPAEGEEEHKKETSKVDQTIDSKIETQTEKPSEESVEIHKTDIESEIKKSRSPSPGRAKEIETPERRISTTEMETGLHEKMSEEISPKVDESSTGSHEKGQLLQKEDEIPDIEKFNSSTTASKEVEVTPIGETPKEDIKITVEQQEKAAEAPSLASSAETREKEEEKCEDLKKQQETEIQKSSPDHEKDDISDISNKPKEMKEKGNEPPSKATKDDTTEAKSTEKDDKIETLDEKPIDGNKSPEPKECHEKIVERNESSLESEMKNKEEADAKIATDQKRTSVSEKQDGVLSPDMNGQEESIHDRTTESPQRKLSIASGINEEKTSKPTSPIKHEDETKITEKLEDHLKFSKTSPEELKQTPKQDDVRNEINGEIDSKTEVEESSSNLQEPKTKTTELEDSKVESHDEERKESVTDVDHESLALPVEQKDSTAKIEERKPSIATEDDKHSLKLEDNKKETGTPSEDTKQDGETKVEPKASIEKVESADSFLTRKFSVVHSEKDSIHDSPTIEKERKASFAATESQEKSPDSISSVETSTTITTEKESFQACPLKETSPEKTEFGTDKLQKEREIHDKELEEMKDVKSHDFVKELPGKVADQAENEEKADRNGETLEKEETFDIIVAPEKEREAADGMKMHVDSHPKNETLIKEDELLKAEKIPDTKNIEKITKEETQKIEEPSPKYSEELSADSETATANTNEETKVTHLATEETEKKQPTEIELKKEIEKTDEKKDTPKDKPVTPVQKLAEEKTLDKQIPAEEVKTLKQIDNKYAATSSEESEESKDINLNSEMKSKDDLQTVKQSSPIKEHDEQSPQEVEKIEIIEKQDHETAETEKGSTPKKFQDKSTPEDLSNKVDDKMVLPLGDIHNFLEQEKLHSHKERGSPEKSQTNNTPKSDTRKEMSLELLPENEKLQEKDSVEPEEKRKSITEQVVKTEKIKIDLTDKPEHAEAVVLKSTPESPIINIVPNLPVLPTDIDKAELGRKSPKEREEDVAKIVASVATVLKSDAPLEVFHKQIPLYTTELRETHITTCDSPLNEKDIEIELVERKDSRTDEANILKDLESSIIVEKKEEGKESPKSDEPEDSGTVHRMLVTASSEDGGEEIEICPAGTITFSKSSESSGRSSPENISRKLSQASSILDTISDQTTVKDQTDVQSKKEPVVEEIVKTSKGALEGSLKSDKPIYPDIKDAMKSLEDQIEEAVKADGKSEKTSEEKPSEIQDILTEAIREVTKDTEDMKDSVSGKIGNVFDSIFSGASKVGEALSHTISDSVKAVETSIDEGLRKVEDEVKHKIEDAETKVIDTLVEKKEKAEHIVADHLRDTVTALSDTIDKTDKAKDSLVKQTEDTLDKMAAPLRETLGDALSNLAESLKHSEETLKPSEHEEKNSKTQETVTTIPDAATSDIEKWIVTSGGEITKQIYPSLKDDITETIADNNSQTRGKVEHGTETISSVIGEAAKDIEKALEELKDDAGIGFKDTSEDITVESSVEKIENEIKKDKEEPEQIDEKISSEIEEKGKDTGERTDDIIATTEETKIDLDKKLEESKCEIQNGLSEIEKLLKDSKDEIIGDIKESGNEILGLEKESKTAVDKEQKIEEKINEKLESSKEDLIGKLDESKETLTNIENTVTAKASGQIGDAEEKISGEVESRKDDLSKAINESKEIAKDTVSEIGKTIADESSNKIEEISGKLDSAKDDLIKELEESKGALKQGLSELENTKKEVEDDLEKRIEETKEFTLDSLSGVSKSATDAIEMVSEVLKSKRDSLGEEIQESKDQICASGKAASEKVPEKSDAVQGSIENVLDELKHAEEGVRSVINDLEEDIDDCKKHINDSAKTAEAEASEEIKKGLDSSSKTAGELKDDISTLVSDSKDNLKEVTERVEKKFETLDKTVEDITEKSKETLETLEDEIQHACDALKKEVDTGVKGFIDDLKSSTKDASLQSEKPTELSEEKESLQSRLETKAESIISSYTDEIKDTLKDTSQNLEENAKMSFESIKNDIDEQDLKKEAANIVDEKSKSAQSVISDISSIIKEEIDSSFKGLVGVEKTIAQEIAETSSDITTTLKSAADKGSSIKEDAKSTIKDVSSSVVEKSGEIVEKGKQELEQKVTDLKTDIEGAKTAVIDKAETVTKDIKDVSSSVVEKSAEIVEKGKQELEQKVTDLKTDIEGAKTAVIDKAETVTKDIKDVSSSVVEKSAEIVEKGRQELEQKVTDLKTDIEGAKTAVIDKAEAVTKDIEDVKDQMGEALTGTKETIETSIGNIKEDLEKEKEAIVNAGTEIETEVKHAVEEVFDAGKKLFGGLFGSKKSKDEGKTKEVDQVSTETKEKENRVTAEQSGKSESVDKGECGLKGTLGLGKSGDISETCDISKGDVQTHLGLEISQEKKLSISDVEIFVDEKSKDSKTAEKESERGQTKEDTKHEDSVTHEIEKHITDVPSKADGEPKDTSTTKAQKLVDDFDDQLHHRIPEQMDPMMMSFYGALPDEDRDDVLDDTEDLSGRSEVPSTHLHDLTKAKFDGKKFAEGLDPMTSSFYGSLPGDEKDPIGGWGKPLGLPSPAPPNERGTPKKERKLPSNVMAKNRINDDRGRSESPSKNKKKINPVYVDLTYVPHHGNSNYAYVDFFKRVRARYYVFSGIEPSREVYNALLEAKQTWEDKDSEVTIIPTYDTDVLGYWVAENEELLTKYKIDLSPSASRCTINLQDHETSCSAYRLEF